MNVPGDDTSEMFSHRSTKQQQLPHEVVDAILDGTRDGDGLDGFDDVAEFAAAVRSVAASSTHAPSPELAAMLAGDAPTAAPLVLVSARRRTSMSITAKAAAGAALLGVVAVSGAAASGALPTPASEVALFVHETRAAASVEGDESNGNGVDGQLISARAREFAAARRATRDEVTEPVGRTPVGVAVEDAETEAEVEVGGRPEEPGQTGLDRAAETPAASVVPEHAPGATAPGVTGDDAPSVTAPGRSVTPPVTGPPVSSPGRGHRP